MEILFPMKYILYSIDVSLDRQYVVTTVNISNYPEVVNIIVYRVDGTDEITLTDNNLPPCGYGSRSKYVKTLISPDNKYVIGCNTDRVAVWRIDNGAHIGKIELMNMSGAVSFGLSPDGQYIVCLLYTSRCV